MKLHRLVALALLPGAWGLVLGVLGVELAYILDCADGQLARLTGRTSPVGSELDFLMDELKAYLLVVGLTARWVLQDGGGTYALFVGLFSLAIIGGALSLTRFVRTPEYAEATGTKRVRHGQSVAEARTRGGMVG